MVEVKRDLVLGRKKDGNVRGTMQAKVWHWEDPPNGLLLVPPGRPRDPGLPWPEGKKEGEGRLPLPQ